MYVVDLNPCAKFGDDLGIQMLYSVHTRSIPRNITMFIAAALENRKVDGYVGLLSV